jgi:predicted dehydrogenase
MESREIDAVLVATPVSTHFELAKKALQGGKHIFVEKPFTSTTAQSQELIDLAEKQRLTIMVDHTFLFTSPVRKIKQLIDDGSLGDLYYYDSMRVNLGLFQHDVNVVWDLAPHDLSIMDFLIKDKPVAIAANGMAHLGNGLHNVAYVTAHFANNMIAHFNVNWLSPVKVRMTLIGARRRWSFGMIW